MRRTFKSYKSVLVVLQFWYVSVWSRIADFVVQIFQNPSAMMSRSSTDVWNIRITGTKKCMHDIRQ